MAMSISTEVRMIKGVGPQRAQLLAERGIYTLEDLLGYLPFRYEDRIHFSRVKDIQPNGMYTIRARVMSGQALRNMRFRRDAIYHLLVQDEAGGLLPCKFFHGGYLEGRLRSGQRVDRPEHERRVRSVRGVGDRLSVAARRDQSDEAGKERKPAHHAEGYAVAALSSPARASASWRASFVVGA